ncbi:hypothetical protein [Microbulbifer sp. ZKSA002]
MQEGGVTVDVGLRFNALRQRCDVDIELLLEVFIAHECSDIAYGA